MKSRYLSLMLAAVLLFAACAKSPAASTWQEQYDLGARYLSEGNYQEAIIAFNAAIEIDPKRADAYRSLADAYAAAGEIDAAREALQRGYDATEDEALQERLELAGLTVLTRQETLRFEDGWRVEYTFAYNDAGYLIRQEERSNDDKGNASASVSTWEYDAEANHWQCYQDGVLDEEMSGEHQRGTTSHWLLTAGGLLAAPFPTDDPEGSGIIAQGEQPARVEHYFDPAYPDIYDENTWSTADYHYDAQGNAVRIDSYNTAGEHVGYCLLEWAVFLPDGSLVPLESTAGRPEAPQLPQEPEKPEEPEAEPESEPQGFEPSGESSPAPASEAPKAEPPQAESYITVKGVQYSTDLTELDLSGLGLTSEDIKELGRMVQLTSLKLHYNEITDISVLQGLTNLEHLNLRVNKISDVEPLAGLVNLGHLDVRENQLYHKEDFAPLKSLVNLEILGAAGVSGATAELKEALPNCAIFR